jgi:hypothetical protein
MTDQREHLPADCCCHVFTRACPVDCLEAVLGSAAFHALVRAEPAPVPSPATVGQVIDLLQAGQLGQLAGIGPRRLGEIKAGLVLAGLTVTGAPPPPRGWPRSGPGSGRHEPGQVPAAGAGQLPALSMDRGEVPGLTLVLPAGLARDQLLAGLAEAIGRARATIPGRAQLFRRRTGECAATGDTLGQAQCRGQALANDQAAAAIDEAIVEAFGLWDHYGAHLAQHLAQRTGPPGTPPP